MRHSNAASASRQRFSVKCTIQIDKADIACAASASPFRLVSKPLIGQTGVWLQRPAVKLAFEKFEPKTSTFFQKSVSDVGLTIRTMGNPLCSVRSKALQPMRAYSVSLYGVN